MKLLQNVFFIFAVGVVVRIVLVIVMLHQAKPAFCCMNEAGSIAASLVAGHGFSNPWPGNFDGKDYPVTGDANSDIRSYKKIDDHTVEVTAKKGDQVIVSGRIV